MSILGTIAGTVGSNLIGGLFGGDDDGGDTRAKQMKRSPLQKELEKMALGQLQNGMPEYEGDLSIDSSQTQQNANSQINNMLKNNDFGMSDKEMDKRMGQTKKNVNQNLENNIQNTFKGMNRRGLMDSDMTSQGLGNAQQKASSELADAETNMYLQNEQLANQQKNNAISQGMNMAQLQTQQQGSNIDRALNDFYRRQQQPMDNAMNVLSSATLPLQRANSGIQQSNAQANAQEKAGLWGAAGNIGGNIMDNWSQSWFN